MTTKQSEKVLPLGRLLLYGAAIYQATQYSHAATLIDPSIIGQLGGLVAGLVVNLSLAYSATKLPSLAAKNKDGKPGKRESLANAGMIGLLLLSPLLVAPANYATMQRDVLGGIWWLQAAWAILWASAMDIAIALVGFIDKSLVSVAQGAPTAGAGAGSAQVVRAHPNRTAAHTADSAGALRAQCAALVAQYACSAPGCTWKPDMERLLKSENPAGSASAMKAGHVKNQHAPVQLDPSLLVNNKEQR